MIPDGLGWRFGALVLAVCVWSTGCAGNDSTVRVEAQQPPGAPSTVVESPTPIPTTKVQAGDLSRFIEAMDGLTPDIHLPSADLPWMVENVPYFAIGRLVGVRPGEPRDGATTKLQCEKAEGVPTDGDCSRTLKYRGVVLSFDSNVRRALVASKGRDLAGGVVEIEFSGGTYTSATDREGTDRLIQQSVQNAPIGTEFALFFGPNPYGLQQVATRSSWGLVEAQHVKSLPGSPREGWTTRDAEVSTILSEINRKGGR